MLAPTASSGALTCWARGDHVHPTDSSLATLDSPYLSGIATSQDVAYPNDSVRIANTHYVTQAILETLALPPPATASSTPCATVSESSSTSNQNADKTLTERLYL